ncbi:MAG TPA: hypothetical protein VJ804_06380 [Acidimicrobiales bacterium]|nr:hypothetical protein [Acidimicrobiales bacterium]
MSDTSPAFDPEAMLRALSEHEVRFVVVGGFAAIYHGSAHLTFDLDITPEMSAANLERLSDALRSIGARVRAGDEDVEFAHDAASLARATVWNLRTPHGDLDLTILPAGTHGYDDLHRDAILDEVLGVVVEVASLADVIRSKAAADRPKDQLTLPTLRRLLEEQES